MDGSAAHGEVPIPISSEESPPGFVRLVRFAFGPDERSELAEAARYPTDPAPLGRDEPGRALLVDLGDDEWLSISITRSRPGPGDDPAWIEMAQMILGDEDGALVAVSPSSAREPTQQAKDDVRAPAEGRARAVDE